MGRATIASPFYLEGLRVIFPIAMVLPSSRSVKRPICGNSLKSSTQIGWETWMRQSTMLPLFTNRHFFFILFLVFGSICPWIEGVCFFLLLPYLPFVAVGQGVTIAQSFGVHAAKSCFAQYPMHPSLFLYNLYTHQSPWEAPRGSTSAQPRGRGGWRQSR